MRFGYVLLGLVTLTSVHISSGQCDHPHARCDVSCCAEGECSNGLMGVQSDEICCAASCGTCGGSDCGQQLGGKSSCCKSRIRDSGLMCSSTGSAPCIIDDAVVCSNGLYGVQKDSVCCHRECGTCGGAGCGQRLGGKSNCCTSQILEGGRLCSTTAQAPCIIDDLICSNGVPGVQKDEFCCEAQCGTCGGSGCGNRPGGQSGCCTSRIRESYIYCNHNPVAPCIIEYNDDDC